MRVLLLSDSHYRGIGGVADYSFDAIFHCGDMDESTRVALENLAAYYVSGNCDFFDVPDQLIEFAGKQILLTHSHHYHSKRGYDELVAVAKKYAVDIVFFGHTHERVYFIRDGIVFINPGDFLSGNFVIIDEKGVGFYNYNDKIDASAILIKEIPGNIFGKDKLNGHL